MFITTFGDIAMNESIVTQISNTFKTEYRQRAEQTKARRRDKGMYTKPTIEQRAAFAQYLSGGANSLSVEENHLLATHPYLTEAQRAEFAATAESIDYENDLLDRDYWSRGGW
jgi:hypothetical protein